MEKGDIEWEVIKLPRKESELWVSGYRGGIRIGSRVIYLLKHREINKDGTMKEMSPPRFMAFRMSELKSEEVPESREMGIPMSRVEFEDLLELLLGMGKRKEICELLYRPILEETMRELDEGKGKMEELMKIRGIGKAKARDLVEAGIDIDSLQDVDEKRLKDMDIAKLKEEVKQRLERAASKHKK